MARSRWLVPLILIIVVAVVAAASLYYFFGKVSSAAKLLPAGTMLYVKVDPNQDSLFPGEEDGYIAGLQSLFWQSFSVSNPFFSYEEDIKPWLGDELILAKQSSDLQDPFVVLAEVGDKTAALKTLERMQTTIGGEKVDATSERYKGVTIYSVDTPYSLSGCYFKGYVVMSSRLESVKEIVDVGSGDEVSLDRNKEFARGRNNLDKENVSMLALIRLREALESTVSTMGITEQLFVKRLNLPEEMMLGVAISKDGAGLRLNTHMGTARFESFAPVDPHLQSSVPSESVVYYEGSNFASLVSEFLGEEIKINKDSLDWANGSYVVNLMPDEGEKRSAFGLIIEVVDEGLARERLQEAEPLIIAALSRLGIKGSLVFEDGSVEDEATRYAVFSEGVRMEINYTVRDSKIYASTSAEGLAKLLDTANGYTTSVADQVGFTNSFEKVFSPEQMGFFYLDTAKFAEFMESGDTVEELSAENPGFLSQVLSPFSNLVLTVKNTGTGSFLTDIFLLFK